MSVDAQARKQELDGEVGQDPGAARPRISVVIPVLNEARNLLEVLPALPPVEQVVLVDGGSVDGSIEVARSILPGVEVLHQTRRGMGNALACGFEAVTGDIVVTMPADGSADPAEIPRFVDALLAGADVAKGSRFLPGGGSDDITPVRGLGNRLLRRRANALFDTAFTDLGYGYNAYWADVLEELALPEPRLPAPDRGMPTGDGFEIDPMVQCRAAATGLAITEVPSRERRRRHGSGKPHALRHGLRALRAVYAERGRARHRAGHAFYAAPRLTGPAVGYDTMPTTGPRPAAADWTV